MAKLLVVDDDEDVLSGLRVMLTDEGHTVRALASGQEALDAIQSDLPELIITDLLMPGMTGLELLRAVRARPACKEIPFIICSGNISLEIEGRLATLAAVSFLRKPLEILRLPQAVAEALAARADTYKPDIGGKSSPCLR